MKTKTSKSILNDVVTIFFRKQFINIWSEFLTER